MWYYYFDLSHRAGGYNSAVSLSMFPITWMYQGEKPAEEDKNSKPNTGFLFLLA